MKYVEFRHLSSEIVAPEVVEEKAEKGVKSWLSSYFMAPVPKSPETEIVDFIKESGKVEEDNKSYWMSDASVKSCFNCNKEFSLTRRKHHCRFCGQIFCWKCAPQRSSPIGVRSCQKCLDLRRKSTQDSPANRRPSTGGGFLPAQDRLEKGFFSFQVCFFNSRFFETLIKIP